MKKTITITLMLLIIVTMMFSRSAQADSITDSIGGHIAGGKASVALVALLVDGTNTLRPIVVARKETSGAVSFSVTRQVGLDMAARAGGWRWRGWGLVVEGMDCVNLELRQGAKVLRSRCEAGIVAGDWVGAISAPDMATFSVAAIQAAPRRSGGTGSGGVGRSGNPPPAPTAGATNPPSMPPAANSPLVPNTPLATSTPRPSDTPHPTATPRPTDTPRPTSTPTPRPTATPTLVPIINEQPATVVMPVVTELPKATSIPPVEAAPSNVVDTPSPESAASVNDTATDKKSGGGIDLVAALGWAGLLLLVFAGWMGWRWWRARQMDKRAAGWAELPTVANDIAQR